MSQLAAKGSRVKVVHRIKNIGSKPIELSPWAVTVLRREGWRSFPSRPRSRIPTTRRRPNPRRILHPQSLVLWPYFSFLTRVGISASSTSRFGQHGRQGAKYGPTKLGLAHRMGWVGYLNDGNLFVKRFDYQEGKTYPDNGCNLETFANADMLDIESLGPLVTLAPGHGRACRNLGPGRRRGNYVHQFEIDKEVLAKIPPK